jgi:pimeloyl-ACP methyl ester carboxylesterase
MRKIMLMFTGLLLVAAAGLLLAGCGSGGQAAQGEQGSEGGEGGASSTSSGSTGGGSGETVSIEGAGEAVIWGDSGNYGVVMSHGAAYDAESWTRQGSRIAENGMVALAVEDNSSESLTAATRYLKEQRGLDGVALLGASAGGQTAIQAAADNANTFDQLLLLSPAGGDVSRLGNIPKLFIYSEDEGLAGSIQQMAREASDPVKTVTVPGSAHAQAIFDGSNAERAMQAIVERLERYAGGDNHP